MTTVDFKTARDLGGKAELTSFDYAGLNFSVPSYPNIVAEYRNEEIREGYLIQEVPGQGFRFIYTELPEFEVGPDGGERQLDAPDEFGPVVATVKEALYGAWGNLYEEFGSPDREHRGWAQRLEADATKPTQHEHIVAEYTSSGFGYLIQRTEDGGYRWIFVEAGEEDEFGSEHATQKGAVRDARTNWRENGTSGDNWDDWSRQLAADADALDSAALDYEAVRKVLYEEVGYKLTPDEVAAVTQRIISLGSN